MWVLGAARRVSYLPTKWCRPHDPGSRMPAGDGVYDLSLTTMERLATPRVQLPLSELRSIFMATSH